MEDRCNFCSSWELPVSVRTGRGFRFRCAYCKHPLANPRISDKTTLAPENMILLSFEAAFADALKNKRNLGFPGASIGPGHFLRMVEDLFWLFTRKTDGDGQLFVHHLNRTAFRMSRRLYYLPQSRPWLGDFNAQNRLALVSHIVALAGGKSIQQRLFLDSARRHFAIPEALKWLHSSDRKQLRRRLAEWRNSNETPYFQRIVLIKEKSLYTLKINSCRKWYCSTH